MNGPAVTQGDGVSRFVDTESRNPVPGRASCADVSDISGTTLCMFSDQFMTKALARAVLWTEGHGAQYPQGRLYPSDSPAIAWLHQNEQGIDLRGGDLLAFYKAAQAACDKNPGNPKICLSKEEKEIFTQVIIPKIMKTPSFVLIAAHTKDGANTAKSIVDHELYHARYFGSKRYREIVEKDWNELNESSPQDRASIESYLNKKYDANDQDLIRNEFQAHSLDTARAIHGAPIGAWSEKLRNDLFREGLLPSNANPYSNTSATITR